MLLSISLIGLIGFSLGTIAEKLHLPRIIGMLLTGILLGPYVFDLIDGKLLDISPELRKLALVIILIKAGLSLNLNDLKKVGRPAILMSFVPACFEISAIIIFGPILLDISYKEAAIMGSVLAAVSPAIVVPHMVKLIENDYGTKKGIPQLILAGSSLDDVFVIVLFTAFLGLENGKAFDVMSFTKIPVSVVLGILGGIIAGFILLYVFKNIHIRDSAKVVIVLSVSAGLVALEDLIADYVAFSGLLAVISMTMLLAEKYNILAIRLSQKFSKLWVAAEILLFVLVGAAVNINSAAKSGVTVILLILIGLIIRSIGTTLCLVKTSLNFKERLFCVISYLPKATVQAAIGSVPLSMGFSCGDIVLTVAVVAILITAPLGAILMEKTYKRLLNKE